MKSEKTIHAMIKQEFVRLHTAGYTERLSGSTVGIAGLGGLGSNAAVSLARAGIGTLVIADFDKVDVGNLNRQYYFIRHVGMPKTEAMTEILAGINPNVTVISHPVRVTESNVGSLFAECDIIVEAFDEAEQKVMLIESVLSGFPGMYVVGGSGIGGFGRSNDIKVERFDRLFICGDGKSEVHEGTPLFGARVALVANMQANTVLELLLSDKVDNKEGEK